MDELGAEHCDEELSDERWDELVRAVQAAEPIARSVLIAAFEFASGNEAFVRSLECRELVPTMRASGTRPYLPDY